ncbi:DNA polymerase III subunit alpha [Mediterraneibacter faecis]|uniref:DNA polymerase III subunit alpha n=2 Tax=Bacteria TaxID=2 RepID=UPI001D01124B|nr:DNA polymerase III subunit alpha [Mediterraneibacter faecis]MBD9338762.1 DNA polymerase III subunit alpha [Mediterraneibacter faecis]MCB5571337.1 DNA polymerase III subunit alpha [Mediterraneibacter faecis]MCB5574459.1 DNA polymerase III subunit alpha [Mediterraneibacter faecis]MCB5741313.1 DNA polymerase III subunit alpha [Mediterraneibacter faecis]MCB5752202.1 DNA polymerase III subunit alpha [Mediterraneibacter faecis]
MSFAHLHVHTEFSLLDGSNKIKEYVSRVKELGMNSAAITDHGVMYGVIDFYREAKKQGINPILGCEVYVAPNSRFDREITGGDDRYYHLVLLAENEEGYANLTKIVSKGFVEGYYYKPRVDKELLRKYHKGIIALSACLAGEVARFLTKGLYEEAKKTALEYQEIFGEGNFFLELQDHGIPEQGLVNQQLFKMSEETGIELVATNDIHYTYAEDAKPHDILLCIQTGKKLSDENRMRYDGGQYYVKSEEEMLRLFPYAKQALENTQKIADRCHVEIEFGVTKLPKYDVPDGYTSWEYLQKLCYEGLEKRYGDPSEELKERLSYELETIHQMGYVDYFLIVWDFIKYAKDHGISVGPGRGSAAGSIVSYCLEITTIDPIRYQLLFERFLNPERVSMPDIDVDFCYERRQEVIDYVTRKYGKDCVAQIVTFGTLAARGVIRDVGRVMDLPYAYVDSISKMIPQELGITIDKALKMNPDLKKLYDTDETVTNLIDMAKRLEGLPRHCSMHAAGVVICQKPVDEYVPLSRAADGTITTQFIMTTLEELGLLKMDFLGLRTLTVIQNAVLLARRKQPELNINQIDYNDQKVLDYIGTGKTDGVFQLESAGMKGFMKELKPHNLEDVIAGISLYRPGPMDFIPQYIRGKNDSSSITYDCPQLEPILAPTYGCIVYQEQVMQIVRDLAGYSLGRSDLLRRAMSKKKAAVMEKERKIFIYGDEETGVPGCIKNGIDEQTANKIYDEMIDFAKYAFNKSHAAAYAVVSYQTAWLKYYFPVEYMAALMTSVIDNPSKVSEYIYACRQMNIKILPPDINKGEANFSVDGGDIRYGLAAIKSIGRPVIKAIVEDREELGLFQNLEDFITRLSAKNVLNKRTIENLIKAGALDTLGGTRKQFMSIYVQIVDHVTQEKKNSMVGQMTLFDLVSEDQKEEFQIRMPDVGEYSKETLLAFEKEVLGIYVSGHPLEAYEEKWKKSISATTADFQLDEETGHTKVHDGAKEIIGGMITEKTIKHTKTNQMMAFITVEDLLGTVEVVVFPRDYEKNRDYLEVDSKVFVRGRVSEEDDKPSKMICEKIIPFERTKKELWIQFPDKATFLDEEQIVYGYLADSDGDDEVMIYCAKERAVKKLPKNRNIGINEQILSRLMNHFGEKRVKVVEKPIENIF